MRPILSRGRRRAALIGTALAICLALPAAANADTTGGGTDGAAHVSVQTNVHVSAKVVATREYLVHVRPVPHLRLADRRACTVPSRPHGVRRRHPDSGPGTIDRIGRQ